jgi:hypothetical protein
MSGKRAPEGSRRGKSRSPHRRPAHNISVVNLENFGRVFDDNPDWIDEIRKDIVTRAVTANASGDWKSGVDHVARTAHYRFEVRHHEGHVIKSVHRGIGDDDCMVITIAAYECHGFGAVRQAKSKRPFIECGRAVDVSGVEIDVGQSCGPLAGWKRCSVLHVMVNEAQHAAAWDANSHDRPAIGAHICDGTVEQRRPMQLVCRSDHLEFRIGMEPKRDSPERRTIALLQGNHMMIDAAGPQIGDALVTRHEIKPPDGRIELLRPCDVWGFEIDAAQCRDWKVGHCRRRSRIHAGPLFDAGDAPTPVIFLGLHAP